MKNKLQKMSSQFYAIKFAGYLQPYLKKKHAGYRTFF